MWMPLEVGNLLLPGGNENFDDEQQIAFKILAATYVLTFYDDAQNDLEVDTTFQENKQNLCHLGRRQMIVHGPLRMFVTGMVGAGKCKFLYRKVSRLTN